MSVDSLFSAHWHRVKDVKPRLAKDVNIVRQVYRGQPNWVLHRRATSEFHRLDLATFELVDRLNGELSIGEVWEQALVSRASAAPSQDEWLQVLAALQAAELLVVDRRVSADKLFERRNDRRTRTRRERWQNPLFLRFALHDPDAWLSRLTPLAHGLFSRTSLVFWLLLLGAGFIAVLLESASLAKQLASPGFPSPHTAALLIVIYPLLKLLHELGHALAVKRGGGEVHEVGIALMVLMPLPYVDASASAAFPRKRDRMLVSAAGIIVELAFAAIGAILWASASGVLADLGLALMLVGGISTLLVNGNPLLRFDAYYLLADAIEIPNLSSRSRVAVQAKLKSLLSGKAELLRRTNDTAERYWLLGYGLLSSVYRVGLMLWIAWWLSGQYLIFGVVLAIYAVVTNLVLPVWKGFSAMRRDRDLRVPRSYALVSVVPAIVSAMVIWLPLPHAHVTQGVVWLPDNALVRITGNCEITAASVSPGQQVNEGQSLFECTDPELPLRERELVAQADEIDAQLSAQAVVNPKEHDRLKARRKANQLALEELRELIGGAYHTAAIRGRFDVPGNVSLEGRALSRGDIAAYVVPHTLRTVRVALDETVASRLDTGLRRIELFTAPLVDGTPIHRSVILSRTLRASLEVPSAALSSAGGGDHRADPIGDGRQVLEPVFNVELEWPTAAGAAPVGAHVSVRFVHSPTPLAGRMADALRRAFGDRSRA